MSIYAKEFLAIYLAFKEFGHILRVAMQTVSTKADIKRALFARLSCTLMRANAQILVSRSLHFAGRTEIDLGGDPTE